MKNNNKQIFRNTFIFRIAAVPLLPYMRAFFSHANTDTLVATRAFARTTTYGTQIYIQTWANQSIDGRRISYVPVLLHWYCHTQCRLYHSSRTSTHSHTYTHILIYAKQWMSRSSDRFVQIHTYISSYTHAHSRARLKIFPFWMWHTSCFSRSHTYYIVYIPYRTNIGLVLGRCRSNVDTLSRPCVLLPM